MGKLAFTRIPSTDDLSTWDALVSRSPQGNLFCRSWWLSAAFGHDFEVIMAERSGTVVAGIPLPYQCSGKRKRVVRPLMTATMGVLLMPPTNVASGYQQQLADEMEIIGGLAAAIPRNDGFSAAFHPSITNWLPFYWQGYEQTTCYT